jgi:hypothetical protein
VGAAVILALAFKTFPEVATLNFKKDRTETMLFEAYSKIQSNNLPYSYAVVNAIPYFGFSEKSHYYYTYDYFNNAYIDLDRRYSRNNINPNYPGNDPNMVLPEAMFVFVYNEIEERNLGKKGISKEQRDLTMQRIELLKLKGRNVELYYQSNNFKVYEIVNREKATTLMNFYINESTTTTRSI